MTRLGFMSLVYVSSLAVQIVLGILFESLSEGLFGRNTAGAPFRCRELMSSGSDDDVLLAVFAILLAPVILRLFRFKRFFSLSEKVVLVGSYSLLVIALTLGPDCGQYFFTAFVVGDPFLVAITLLAVFSVLFAFRVLTFK